MRKKKMDKKSLLYLGSISIEQSRFTPKETPTSNPWACNQIEICTIN